MFPQTHLTFTAILCIFAVIVTFCSASQFCEVKSVEQHDFCIAVNTFHNESSGAEDFYVTMSAKFPDGNGWLAIGSGYIMHRSLMFAMYPGAKHGSVVVGPRSTSFHDAPMHIEGMPDSRVISTSYDEGYSNVNFLCYACNRWDGSRLSIDAETQPWIWATNDWQDPLSDDPNKKLDRHDYYDFFYVDMKSAQMASLSEPSFPTIGERKSISAGKFDSKARNSPKSNSYLIHGSMLGLAFGVLFPLGVLTVVSERWSSVRNHWMIQTATSFCALVGISFGLATSVSQNGVHALFGPHQLIGCTVGILLIAQFGLGLWHHVQYLESQWNSARPSPRAWMKVSHKWIGRGIYILGCFNVITGLNAAQKTNKSTVGWVVIMAVEIIAYLVFSRRSSKESNSEVMKSHHAYDPVNMSEETIASP